MDMVNNISRMEITTMETISITNLKEKEHIHGRVELAI